MASIQRRDGRTGTVWRVMYRVDGKMRSDTFADPKSAERHKRRVETMGGAAARELLDRLEGRSGDDPTDTLTDYARRHVADLDVTPGTRRDYERMIDNRLAGTLLGALPVDAVTRDAVAAWTRALPGAPKTRRNYHALVSSVLEAAARDGVIPSNPAKGVKIRQDVPMSDMVILTPGELAILVAELPQRYQPFVTFLAGTGLRFGEATALLVGSVDLDAAVPLVRVTQAFQRTGTGERVLGPPKTRAGVRTVSLPPEVVDAVSPLVEGRATDAYVFTNERGKPIRGSNFHTSAWGPALRRLNDSGRMTKHPRVHDLRHYQASQQVAAGVPLNAVQKRLGHESITTTVDRYSHLAPDYLAVTAAAASLGLRQTQPEIEG